MNINWKPWVTKYLQKMSNRKRNWWSRQSSSDIILAHRAKIKREKYERKKLFVGGNIQGVPFQYKEIYK